MGIPEDDYLRETHNTIPRKRGISELTLKPISIFAPFWLLVAKNNLRSLWYYFVGVFMSGVRLVFADPELEEFRVKRSEKYPQELRLALKVRYRNIILELTTPENKHYSLTLREPVPLYLASSKGSSYIELFNPSTGKKVTIKAGIHRFWHPFDYPAEVDIVSEPLSLQEIHEIDELIGGEQIKVYWSVECLGFLDQGIIHSLVNKGHEFSRCERELRGPVHIFFYGPEKITERSRQDFVRNVLEPADMLRREFIEVVVEPISEEVLDKLPVEFREALRVLLEKQKLLLEALRGLRYATTATDYRNVIDNARRVIEGLTPQNQTGQQVYQALELAFKTIPIAGEIDAGALNELSEEVVGTINSFSSALFKYSSKFVHGKTESGKLYKPHPNKSEAEFAVLQAMLLLNYMIRTIKTAAHKY